MVLSGLPLIYCILTAVVSSLDTMIRVSAVAAFPPAVEFSSATFFIVFTKRQQKNYENNQRSIKNYCLNFMTLKNFHLVTLSL